MKPRHRLTSQQRRQAIIDSVTDAFAQSGLNGTTTRELASAAGVSEALIYKHFPSKESLYAAMLDACLNGPAFAEFKRLLALQPSSATLVRMVHFTISHYVRARSADPGSAALNCFMARSLLEDGEFARLTHRRFAGAWIAKFAACLKKAAGAGDLRKTPIRAELSVWFIQHMAFALMLHLRPAVPVVDYRASSELLIQQATWFALLGLGMSPSAIERHYRPRGVAAHGRGSAAVAAERRTKGSMRESDADHRGGDKAPNQVS